MKQASNAISNLENWKNAKECAEFFGCSEWHFKNRISKQHNFPKPVGKKWYWPDVVRFEQGKAA